MTWLSQVAASAGLSVDILTNLAEWIDKGKLTGSTADCMESLFCWLEQNPGFVLRLLRPSDVEGLFGKDYKALPSAVEQARFALPVLRALSKKWMAGKPLCEIEQAAGAPIRRLGTCETARHFVNRVVPDIAFVAGLPARVLSARLAEDFGVTVPTVIATLAGAVRRGCDSPEALANAVHLGHEKSRVGSRRAFENIRRLIPPSDEGELFETTLERVRAAHMIAMFE